MSFEARTLRAFLATVREGSVSRAAESLGVRQPTVSAQLRKLELTLGFELLRRTTRRIELTAEGKRLLPLVDALLKHEERLKRSIDDIRGRARSTMKLGSAVYQQQLPERVALLDAFTSAHPELQIEIDNRLQMNHVNALLRGELDAAFLVGCPVSRRGGAWDRGELLFPADLPRLVLQRRPVDLMLPATSPLTRFAVVPAYALSGQSVLMLGPAAHGPELVEPVIRFLKSAAATVVVPAESTELALARHVRQSGKLAMSTGWFRAPGEQRGELVRRRIEGLAVETELALVFRKGERARPARALHAFVRKHVGR
jgi:DNA-binding transcriptional LysR family regulator